MSADFKYRFRFDGKGKDNSQSNVIKALSKPLSNRDVRVHDFFLVCPKGYVWSEGGGLGTIYGTLGRCIPIRHPG